MTSVVIIGSGIAGASVAYHLIEEDIVVTVVDKGELGSETTPKATGVFDWTGHTATNDKKIVDRSWNVYEPLIQSGDLEFEQLGYMRLAQSEEKMDVYMDLAKALNGYDIETHVLDSNEVSEYNVNPEAAEAGAIIAKSVGRLNPKRVGLKLIEKSKATGIEFRSNVKITDIFSNQNHVTGVETAKGQTLDADIVVNAAGPWAPEINALAGESLPLKHYLQPMRIIETTSAPKYPILVFESGHYLVFDTYHDGPNDRLFFGYEPQEGDVEDSFEKFFEHGAATIDPDIDRVIDDEYREDVTSQINQFLSGLEEFDEVESYICTPCLSPDGRPLAGETSLSGYYVLNGLCGVGVTRCPGIAELVVNKIISDTNHELLEYLSPYRFSR